MTTSDFHSDLLTFLGASSIPQLSQNKKVLSLDLLNTEAVKSNKKTNTEFLTNIFQR